MQFAQVGSKMKGFLTLPSHHIVPGIHLLMQPSSLGLPSSVEAKYNAREIIIMLRIQGLHLPFFSTTYTFIILVLQISTDHDREIIS